MSDKNKDDELIEDFDKKKKDKKKKDKKEKKEKEEEPEEAVEDNGEDKKEKKKKDKKDKKKKKEEDEEEPTQETEAAAENSDEKKKEKKDKKKKDKKDKKKKKEEEDEGEEGDDAPDAGKKPDDVPPLECLSAEEEELENWDELIIDFSDPDVIRDLKKATFGELSKMEKLISEIIKPTTIEKPDADKTLTRVDLNNVTGHDAFKYENLLQRISDQVTGTDTDKAAFKLIEPQCQRSATKSSWVNFGKQAEAMKRDPMHVLGFYRNELGCNGTIGNDDMLILNGAYQQKHFIRIIKKYFEVYLKCDVCNGYDTILEKDTKTRLEYLRCNCCKASRTVPPITKTFEAARRGERRKNR